MSIEAPREQRWVISFAFHLSQLKWSFSSPGLQHRADPSHPCGPGSEGRIGWFNAANTDRRAWEQPFPSYWWENISRYSPSHSPAFLLSVTPSYVCRQQVIADCSSSSSSFQSCGFTETSHVKLSMGSRSGLNYKQKGRASEADGPHLCCQALQLSKPWAQCSDSPTHPPCSPHPLQVSQTNCFAASHWCLFLTVQTLTMLLCYRLLLGI